MQHRTKDDVPPLFGHLLSELEDGIRMRELGCSRAHWPAMV